MRIIKYFFEEPTFLEFPEAPSSKLPSDSGRLIQLLKDQRYFRGYLAASDSDNDMIGGSALSDYAAAKVLATVLIGPVWLINKAPGIVAAHALLSSSEKVVQALVTMSSESIMISELNPDGQDLGHLIEQSDREQVFRTIARLLDIGATVVFPEPAHVGHDWSVYSARGLSDEIRRALSEAPSDYRSYVIPYAKARGEHQFYFEQYDIDLFARYEVK